MGHIWRWRWESELGVGPVKSTIFRVYVKYNKTVGEECQGQNNGRVGREKNLNGWIG